MIPQILATIKKFALPILTKAKATQTGTLFSEAKALYKGKGLQPTLDRLQEYKGLSHLVEKGQKSFVVAPDLAAGTRVGRMTRSATGNVAASLKTLTKDVQGSGSMAPVVIGKNFMDLFGQNIRAATKTTLESNKIDWNKLVQRRGNYFYKGKKVHGITTLKGENSQEVLKSFMDNKGNIAEVPGLKRELVLDRTLPGKAFGVATSAPMLGYGVYASEKDKPLYKRVGRGLATATTWTVAPGPTLLAEAGVGLAKYLKNKKKVIGGNYNGVR